MANLAHSYAEIVKYNKNADGTLTVYGLATSDALDIDHQICDASWLERAMPTWFKTGGNIREQHSNIAAGVATDYELKADGHYISALVVDPVSVKKVETGVLKGFSVGIKNPRVIHDKAAANGRIVDGQIVEVSLVDRPANPNAKLVLAKSSTIDGEMVQVEDLIEKKKDDTDYENMIPSRKGEPADKELYNRVKREAKEKFDVYPSAVANAWVVREYKARGGKYKSSDGDKALHSDSDEGNNSMSDTVEVPKSVLGELLKFDKAKFEAARDALADLISVEAEEMKQGHNEIRSLTHLLEAISHLHAWYEGEEMEGEVEITEETVEMSADSDTAKSHNEDHDEKMCESCGKSMKMCKCNKDADADDSDMEEKSVEGESEEPAVSDAPASEDAPAEESSDSTKSENLEELVAKAVRQALEPIEAEVASLKSAKEAAEEKAAGLEGQLADALNKAAGGGPRRTAKTSPESLNDYLIKAANYRAKAAAATDPHLAKGYRTLADEFAAKAVAPDTK